MDINKLHDSNLISIAQQEQALAWLIEQGPVIENPPVSMALLRNLVKRHRLIRLRNGLYLAPRKNAKIPSLAKTINLVDPPGYISGHGALSLHDLNDQDISRWYSVTSRRQPDISYGQSSVHFVLSPERRRVANTGRIFARDEWVVAATPARAIVDEAGLLPFGLNYAETIRILRYAIDTQATTEAEILSELKLTPAVSAARRLGFMLELATGHKNAQLLKIAQSVSGMTKVSEDDTAEYPWRLYLPQSRSAILGASR